MSIENCFVEMAEDEGAGTALSESAEWLSALDDMISVANYEERDLIVKLRARVVLGTKKLLNSMPDADEPSSGTY